MNTSYKRNCLNVDCPERTGGECIIKELIKLEEKPDKQSYMRGFHDGQDSLLDNGQIRLVPADEVLKAQLKLLDELQVNEWKDDHARLYMTRDAFYSLIEAKRKKVVGIKLV